MDSAIKDQIEKELIDLIELGEKAQTKFQLEKCDYIPTRYSYLDEYPEEDWDEEDRKTKKEYDEYLKRVENIKNSLASIGEVSAAYERFYTQAYRVISELLPERLDDFETQYKPQKNRKEISYSTYTIYDGLRGSSNTFRNAKPSVALARMQSQIDILSSLKDNLGSRLFEIEEVLRADLFDSELESARHLSGRGHLRAAGAVAGVVLEKHLGVVARRHGFATRKKAPSIADFNEYLKSCSAIDVVQWRRVQGLADIRNLCDHPKDREPTPEDIEDLISGTERVLKQVL